MAAMRELPRAGCCWCLGGVRGKDAAYGGRHHAATVALGTGVVVVLVHAGLLHVPLLAQLVVVSQPTRTHARSATRNVRALQNKYIYLHLKKKVRYLSTVIWGRGKTPPQLSSSPER
jgi:hypothetical protein